jgi:Ca2+-binding EF-hand superfamily protein
VCAQEEAILSAFRVFDKENTGKIDADELRHIFVTLGDALTQEEVTESLKLVMGLGFTEWLVV